MKGGKFRAGTHGRARPAIVFDVAQRKAESLMTHEVNGFSGFRRSAADSVEAREIVTGAILGDPRPGQFNHRPLWSYHKENRR